MTAISCYFLEMDAEDMAEDHLIKSAQLGDLKAFEMLVRQHQDMVYAVAYQIVGNADDAQDVCQTCFIKVHRDIGKYRPKAKFSTWLYRIAVNAAIDFQRRQKSDRFVVVDEAELVSGKSDLDVQLSLERVLEGLTPKQRVAFVLRDLQGFPLDEVAEILKCSSITVRVHLHNARRYVRKRMEQER